MLLYNVTVILEENAAQEWLEWMTEVHIPAVLATGKFISHRLLKVVDSPNEGVTYCVQYIANSMQDYDSYMEEFASQLQTDHHQKFENRYVSFRTLMEYIN